MSVALIYSPLILLWYDLRYRIRKCKCIILDYLHTCILKRLCSPLFIFVKLPFLNKTLCTQKIQSVSRGSPELMSVEVAAWKEGYWLWREARVSVWLQWDNISCGDPPGPPKPVPDSVTLPWEGSVCTAISSKESVGESLSFLGLSQPTTCQVWNTSQHSAPTFFLASNGWGLRVVYMLTSEGF